VTAEPGWTPPPEPVEPPNRLADLPLFSAAAAPAALREVPAGAGEDTASLAQLAAADAGPGQDRTTLAHSLRAAVSTLARDPATLAHLRVAAVPALAHNPEILAHSRGHAGSPPPATETSALAAPTPTDLPAGPPVRLTAVSPAEPAGRVPVGAVGAVDWAQVRAFRQQAAELLTAQLRDRAGLDEPARREIGRSLIVAMLRDHADSLLAEGAAAPSAAEEQALAGAIFDALFGLGRLQPLVDDPDVENIEITGCNRVHLVYGDGRVRPGPPVADSDEELIETLAFLAARSGGSSGSGERAFTPANPILDLTLHGGARLAARAWITPRPAVVIRRHRLSEVDLADLQRLGMVDGVLAEFLAAAVRANKTIVVSGPQGARKDNAGPGAVQRDGSVGTARHNRDRVRAAPARDAGAAPPDRRARGPARDR
jgi:hypothetical protein